MVAAAEATQRINVVNFSIRYSGAGRTMKRLVDEGAVGDVLSAWRLRSRGYGLYTAGARHPAVVRPDHSGGWTMHHMCHDIDAIYWLVGAYEKVWSLSRTTVPESAQAGGHGGIGHSEELIWAMAELNRTGQAVRPMAMLGDAVHRYHLEDHGVTGTKGTMHLERQAGQWVVVLQPEGGETGLRSDSGKALPKHVFETESSAEPGGGLGHFFDCIVNGKSSQVTFRDARAAVRVALACQQSARSGGQPVRVGD
jgi:predicted dehydrogenase